MEGTRCCRGCGRRIARTTEQFRAEQDVFEKIAESLRPFGMVEDLNDDHSNTQSVEVRVMCNEVRITFGVPSGFDNCKTQWNKVGLQS